MVKDRGRTPSTLSTTRAGSRRGSRSLSPIRGDGDFHKSLTSSSSSSTTTTTTTSSLIRSGGSKKWRLKDLLLFRSASEGRVIGRGSKDPLRKYTMLSSSRSLLPSLSNKRRSSGREDAKNSGSKPGDKNGSVRRGSSQAATSAHEVHYTTNRAVSEELKKKRHTANLLDNACKHALFGNPAGSRRDVVSLGKLGLQEGPPVIHFGAPRSAALCPRRTLFNEGYFQRDISTADTSLAYRCEVSLT